jgi:hypothetical protein
VYYVLTAPLLPQFFFLLRLQVLRTLTLTTEYSSSDSDSAKVVFPTDLRTDVTPCCYLFRLIVVILLLSIKFLILLFPLPLCEQQNGKHRKISGDFFEKKKFREIFDEQLRRRVVAETCADCSCDFIGADCSCNFIVRTI